MAKLVDAGDLKSPAPRGACRFDSGPGDHSLSRWEPCGAPPRARNQPLPTGGLVRHLVLVSAFFPGGVFGIYFCAIDRGRPIKLERTLAVNTLVVMEIFHLFFIRNIYGTSLTW